MGPCLVAQIKKGIRKLISSSETVRLRASDPEAVAYLKSLAAKPDLDEDRPDLAAKQPLSRQETPNPPPASLGLDKSTAAVNADVPASTSVAALSVTARPKGPPRRKRQTLEQMSAALDKGKKMTTLEKVLHFMIDSQVWGLIYLSLDSRRWTGKAILHRALRWRMNLRPIGETVDI